MQKKGKKIKGERGNEGKWGKNVAQGRVLAQKLIEMLSKHIQLI